jgi:hypothetical protein
VRRARRQAANRGSPRYRHCRLALHRSAAGGTYCPRSNPRPPPRRRITRGTNITGGTSGTTGAACTEQGRRARKSRTQSRLSRRFAYGDDMLPSGLTDRAQPRSDATLAARRGQPRGEAGIARLDARARPAHLRRFAGGKAATFFCLRWTTDRAPWPSCPS